MPLPTPTLDVDETPPPPVSKRRSSRRTFIEWLIVLVVAVLVSLLVRTYAVQTFFIPSGSMEPTLQIGDRIIVNKLSVEFGTIHVGDILVFRAPKAVALTGPHGCSDKVADLVKRVVGVPGDHLVSKGNTIYVNGKPLKQPWTHVAQIGVKPIKPTYVKKNHYFMMGDNEPGSCDSRYWGLIPRSAVIGKAFARIWPLSRLGFL